MPGHRAGCAWVVAVAAGFLALGCGHATRARPTPHKRVQAEIQLGGPLFILGDAPIPLPLSTVGASYGVGERYDVEAHAHLTAAAFNVAGLDVGTSYLLIHEQWPAPALSANLRLYGFTDFRSGSRAYLETTFAGSYLFRERFLTYVSATAFLQTQGQAIFTVAAGGEVSLGDVGLQLEWRWYGFHQDTRYSAVDWLAIGPLGAWGLVLGARYRFGEGS